MPRKKVKAKTEAKATEAVEPLAVINPNAAAIDIGSEQHVVAVPAGRDTESVRSFGSFTADIHEMGRWFKACGVTSVVMEATGVYWMPPFQILEQDGLEVHLIDPRAAKNLPGRKSDVLDCQWHQKLHSFGLLSSCFVPPAEILPLRTYLRLRQELVQGSSQAVERMQKALFAMNVQLANVISDLTGETGLAIIKAILAGEREGTKLAELKNRRIQASKALIAKSLEGNWKEELLYALQTALKSYEFHQQQIEQCEQKILEALAQLPKRQILPQNNGQAKELQLKNQSVKVYQLKEVPPTSSQVLEPLSPLAAELKRIAGVDLTSIDGIGEQTAQVVLSEFGPDLKSRFKSEKHFSSYLGLCPGTRISGGKVLNRRSRKVSHRLATALRLAARSLSSSQSALGANYRRLRSRLGAPKAITAVANKLAKLVYRLLVNGQDYFDHGIKQYEEKFRRQQIRRLEKQAKMLNLKVIPA
jgi:transposase